MQHPIFLIARRELAAYLRTMSGYVIIAVMLFLDGFLFNVHAVPGVAKKSAEVLSDFFWDSSGITLFGAAALAMRLIAEERQTGTITLLYASPVKDLDIVLGKFLSALAFLSLFLLSTLSMPALVAIYGKVSLGHIFAGYLGLFLVGAAGLAIGTFASALTRSQLVALISGVVMCVALTMCWLLAKVTDRPLTEVLNGVAWYPHFDPFRNGLVQLQHVAYFVLVSFLGLFAATRVLEARRWR